MKERPTMRKFLSTSLKILITIAVLYVIVRKLGWTSMVESLEQAQFGWLAGALAIFVASCGLGVVQWQLLLRNRKIIIPFRQAFSLYFIGMFFNNFFLGTAAGDAVRVAYIKLGKGSGSGRASLAATFLDRFAGLWAMLGFAVVGSFILLHHGLIRGLPLTTAVISLCVTFVLFGGIMCLLVSKRLQRVLFALLDRLPIPKRELVESTIRQMLLETGDARLMVEVALLSTAVQTLRIVVHMCCGAALGLLTPENYQYYFIFVPLLGILMIVPTPFGVREAIGGTLFALAGFAPNPSVVMGFLASLVGIAGSLPGGVLFVRYRARTKEPTSP